MSEVSVIGVGAMGSAIVETLESADNRVSIWNRTRERAERLSGSRVEVAETLRAALAASPLAFVCVSDYDVTRDLLRGAAETLRGKTVVQVASGTPDAARELGAFVDDAGGRYLDVAIMGYPSDIGADSTQLFFSGDREAFEKNRTLFESLGTTSYVAEDPGAAFVSEFALTLPYLPLGVGLFQGARVCELEGLSLEWYADSVRRAYPTLIDSIVETIRQSPDPADPATVEASVRVWRDGAADYAEYLRELDLDAGVYDALYRLFAAGVDEGRGDHDWSCVAELSADHPESTS